MNIWELTKFEIKVINNPTVALHRFYKYGNPWLKSSDCTTRYGFK